MKTEYKKNYSYFLNFKKELEARKLYNSGIKGKFPFYTLFQFNNDTFSPYKVAWKYISGGISGKGHFYAALIEGKEKVVMPNEKIVFIPCKDKGEAYYLIGILNSSIAHLLVMSYTVETAISTHVMNNINVPLFQSNNNLHKDISELSAKAHILAKNNEFQELENVEKELDKKVAELYKINTDELDEIYRTIKVLKEGESEETEEELEEQQTLSIGNELAVKIEPLNIIEGKEYNLTIDFLNNSKENISINGFEVLLNDKPILKVEKTKKIKANEGVKGPLTIGKLSKGKYKLTLNIEYSTKEEEKQLKESRTLYVEQKKEQKKGSWDDFEKMLK